MNIKLLNKSMIGRDFLRLKDTYSPSIDQMLDWRNQLKTLQSLKKYPSGWYDLEIQATDEIINILNLVKAKQ